MKVTRRSLAVLIGTTACAATLTGTSSSPAVAATGPVFSVMNTSETPPDGVWFRNSPHTADTSRITGLGVYMNEQVQLECYSFGDAVGPYNDSLWYYVLDVSRPVNAGAPNQGFLNAHYINDGQNANVVDSGVPACVNNAPPVTVPPVPVPPSATPISVFYSPFNYNDRGTKNCGSWCGMNLNLSDSSVKTSYVSQWFPTSPHGCGDITAAYAAATPSGSYPTTLAGWSFGRVGVLLALQQAARQGLSSSVLSNIDYVLLIDPGPYGDLTACDSPMNAGGILANWLQLNPNAHLVVISGSLTQQDSSKGIQQVYFNQVRNIAAANHSNIRSQVLVCNYPIDHYTAYYTSQYWIAHKIGSNMSSCPWLSGQGKTYKPTAGWHP